MIPDRPAGELLSLLVRPGGLATLLGELHGHLLQATGGRAVVLLQPDPSGTDLWATSGTGLDDLPIEGWLTESAAVGAWRHARDTRREVWLDGLSDAAPTLARRLSAGSALFLPLVGASRVEGLLLTAGAKPTESRAALRAIGAAYVVALERSRLQRDAALQRDLREAVARFAREMTAPDSLATALGSVCQSAGQLFGADDAVVWLHDRQKRQLAAVAASNQRAAPREPVSADDLLAAEATALRRDRAEIVSDTAAPAAGVMVTVPLRGRRRALGVLVLEGVRIEPGATLDVLERADETGRQIAAAIENAQLLDDVLRTRQKLAHAEKLAALGQFVAGAAHELNNPLQGVLGHVDLLLASGGLSGAARQDVKSIGREAARAARIVEDLLVFGGTSRLRPRKVDAATVVRRILAGRARLHAKRDIEVREDYDDAAPPVRADGRLLARALMNIVVNAEQAIGAGGRITVQTRAVPNGTAILVSDSGPGLPEDVLPRVFEPFFTTKDAGKGTGLGLAIAYGIVQDHGGAISAGNAPGGGALFTLTLPAWAAQD